MCFHKVHIKLVIICVHIEFSMCSHHGFKAFPACSQVFNTLYPITFGLLPPKLKKLYSRAKGSMFTVICKRCKHLFLKPQPRWLTGVAHFGTLGPQKRSWVSNPFESRWTPTWASANELDLWVLKGLSGCALKEKKLLWW